jgi:hypothetical protein
MQYFTDLGEAFGLAEDMIMAALDTLTDELQRAWTPTTRSKIERMAILP